MRSSDGHHWIALDHIRAVAALLVFNWHFTHWDKGFPVPFQGAPTVFPLALLDEGHTGVALFMALSGYLFAKLLDNKNINYGRFYWNRFLRLAPLLVVVIILTAIIDLHHSGRHFDVANYFRDIAWGWLKPTFPNGGWSITVETHFYLLLPFILLAMRKQRFAPLLFLCVSILVRALIWKHDGSVQYLAYYSIVGRADQFILGIVAFQNRELVRRRTYLAAVGLIAFMGFYYWFDLRGGFYGFGGIYPSPTPLWIILPTIEGAVYAWLIAYYDSSFSPRNGGFSALIGRFGTYSYSIYLLHSFIVFRESTAIDRHIIGLSNFYVATFAATVCFGLMIIPGWMSYVFIEKPFLRFRKRYTAETH